MPNKLKDAVRHKFARKNYNQRDWKAYDQTLVNQGSINIWFNEEAISQWNQAKPLKLPRGRPRIYSELAIQTCHTLRFLNKKALRQTQGFIASIITMLKWFCRICLRRVSFSKNYRILDMLSRH